MERGSAHIFLCELDALVLRHLGLKFNIFGVITSLWLPTLGLGDISVCRHILDRG